MPFYLKGKYCCCKDRFRWVARLPLATGRGLRGAGDTISKRKRKKQQLVSSTSHKVQVLTFKSKALNPTWCHFKPTTQDMFISVTWQTSNMLQHVSVLLPRAPVALVSLTFRVQRTSLRALAA